MIGQTISHYRILGKLGGGGMGVVYEAEDTRLGRHVAIKFLPDNLSGDSKAMERFEREARAASLLNHPSICTIFEVEDHNGHPFIVMEKLEGESLKQRIRGKAMDLDDLLDVGVHVADALSASHAKGIIHRDIKPANVMIDTESHVKVADFGLARVLDASAADAGRTMTGIVMGTPDYMAPEQMRGMHVDHSADIYSVGVMLYEMLCREVPRGAFAPPSVRGGCDPRLDAIVLKAMQQSPERRYQSAKEMEAALEAARSPLPSVQCASSRAVVRRGAVRDAL